LAIFGGGFYLLFGLFDLEVYRYLRQHINLAYIRTYIRPSVLMDDTFLLVLKTDGFGNLLFAIFAITTVVLCMLLLRRSSAGTVRPNRIQVMLFGLLAAWLISSPYWYSPTHSRRDRISPPISVLAKELVRFVERRLYRADPVIMEKQLARFGHRQGRDEGVFLEQYPLIHLPIEYVCRYHKSAACLTDADGDGFDRSRDCDDANAKAHPEHIDVPSDGIDQDCDGIDAEPVSIVLLVVESLHRDLFLGELKNEKRLKNIRRMMDYGGTLFTRAISNGFPSVYGAASIYLGLWNPPNQNIFGEYAGQGFRGFPEYLPDNVYAKHIVTASDPYFDNQAPWLQLYYGSVDYDKNDGKVEDADELAFSRAIDWLGKQPVGEPFLLTINNHSTHMPFAVPETFLPSWEAETKSERYLKSLHYFDTQFGRLLDALEARGDVSNVAFVLIGDHGFPIQDDDFALPSFYGFQKSEMVAGVFSRNQNLFTSTRTERKRVVSQIDVGPTILDLVGVKAPHHFQGSSWLKENQKVERLAVFMKNDVFSVHGDDGVVYGHYSSEEPVFVPSDDRSSGAQRDLYLSATKDVSELAKLTTFLVGADRVWSKGLMSSPVEFFAKYREGLIFEKTVAP
ncbi:MAG: sulfatase-like hydrolase/transferase, partial [Bradymonadia bacterium]